MTNEFPFSLFEYSTYIFVLLTIWIVYVRYKEGYYSKTSDDEAVDSGKKLSKFQRWWRQSFIREIYVVRAGKRPFLCALPWVGVAFSLIGILFYIVRIYLVILSPTLPLEQLTKYEGQVVGYKFLRKFTDRLIVQLNNGETKTFLYELRTKEETEKMLNQPITIWAQEEKGILDFGERIVWKQYGNNQIDLERFNEHYIALKAFENGRTPILIYSLKFLIFFLVVLLFINRNPVKNDVENKT